MIDVKRLIFCVERFIATHKADIYTGLACVGVIGTAVTSSVAGSKTERDLIELKSEKIPREEIFKKVAKNYILPAAVAAATIGCTIKSRAVSKAQFSALLATIGAMDIKAKKNEAKVSEAPNDITLFYDTLSGEFFTSTVEDVLLAEYHFNRNFILRSYALVGELYDFLEWHPSAVDFREFETMNGWWADIGESEYGYVWVDFEHRLKHLDDGTPYYEIIFPFEPVPGPYWFE